MNASGLTLIPKSTGLEDLESADLMPTELPVLEKDSGSHEKAKKLVQNQDADESVALSVLKSVDCNPSSYALSCIDTHTAADVEIVSCKLSARPRKLSASAAIFRAAIFLHANLTQHCLPSRSPASLGCPPRTAAGFCGCGA
jgi:hypothetical protein